MESEYIDLTIHNLYYNLMVYQDYIRSDYYYFNANDMDDTYDKFGLFVRDTIGLSQKEISQRLIRRIPYSRNYSPNSNCLIITDKQKFMLARLKYEI
jgi:hypothetical protein